MFKKGVAHVACTTYFQRPLHAGAYNQAVTVIKKQLIVDQQRKSAVDIIPAMMTLVIS